MGRRNRGRRASTLSLSSQYADPFALLGATLAWRADDATDNGANTTTLPSYIGSLTLNRNATGQAIKAASANFSGKLSIAFGGANAGYSNALAVSASMSFVSVYRVTAVNSGVHAFTAGGVANTGNSSGYTTLTFSQKVVTNATRALATPVNVIAVSVFSAASVTHYANRYTPATTAVAGALVGDSLTIGALDTAGTFTLTGEWRTTAYFNRALTPAEAVIVLRNLGLREGIAISP